MYLDVEGVGKVHNATFRDSFSMYVSMCWFVNPGVNEVVAPPPLDRPSSADELAMALQLSMESAEAEKIRSSARKEANWEDFSWDIDDSPDNKNLSFTVGKYIFDQDSYVREKVDTNSKVLREIDAGEIVTIKSVKPIDGRIRGELTTGGFVTLMNFANGKQFVSKIEDANPSSQKQDEESPKKIEESGGLSALEYQGMITALNVTIDEQNREIERKNLEIHSLKAKLGKVSDDLRSTTKGLQKATEQLEDKNDCVICQDEPKSHIILPCMHLCVCGTCAQEYKLKDCPLCMKRFTSIKKVFM